MKKNVFDKNPPHHPSYLYFIKVFQVENGFTPLPSPLKIRLSERRSLLILPCVRILSKVLKKTKNFLEKFNDMALLADLMGHESIETTRIYLRRSSLEQQEIVDKVITW